MTRNQALSLIGVVAATWPQANLSPDTINSYATFLSDLDHEDAFEAVGVLAGTLRKPPTVADIREMVAEMKLGLPTTFVAWEQFVNRDPDQHELVRRVAKTMGGHSAYRMSDVPSIFRAQFVKMYEQVRSEAVRGEATSRPLLPPPPERPAIAERALDSEPITAAQRAELVTNLRKLLKRSM